MKVINAMGREQFVRICEMGEAIGIALQEKMEAEGIDSGNVGSALLVALAGVLKNAEDNPKDEQISPDDMMRTLEGLKGLWAKEGAGIFLRIGQLQEKPQN